MMAEYTAIRQLISVAHEIHMILSTFIKMPAERFNNIVEDVSTRVVDILTTFDTAKKGKTNLTAIFIEKVDAIKADVNRGYGVRLDDLMHAVADVGKLVDPD